MKKTRKLVALALAMLMTFQPSITAFAEEPAAEVIEELAEQVIEAAEEETEAAEEETEAAEEETEAAEEETEAAEEETEAAEKETEAAEEETEAAEEETEATEEETEAAEEETEAAEEESKAAEVTAEAEKKEEAPAEKKAEAEDLILTAEAEDGMQVTMTAKAGTFKYDEGLELVASVVTEAEAEEADEDLAAKTKNDNVAKRVTYDIKVMYGEEEVEPLNGKKVQVNFALPEVPAGADAVSVYHHKDNGAVETIVKDEEVEGGEGIEVGNIEGETDGFSYYTVDFTYDEKTVSIPGGSCGTPLDEILAEAGIAGSIAKAAAYQDAACTVPAEGGEVKLGGKVLFSVYELEGSWYVDAVNAFQTEHGLIVTMDDGSEFKITVTDANALFNVKYMDEEGNEQTVDGLANAVSTEDFTWGDDGNDGWYVVYGDITAEQGYEVTGDVKLILMDGSSLTINAEEGQAGIRVSGEKNSLTVYAQSGAAGELTAVAGSGAAGIGGGSGETGEFITINGGKIYALGKDGGAGIGGGYNGGAWNIIINGGSVLAKAEAKADGIKECGAGIGSGCFGEAVNIQINGGSVGAVSEEGGAAIGAGNNGTVTNIVISGEDTAVRATANGKGAPAIGGSTSGTNDISIEGGYVELISSRDEAGKAVLLNINLFIDAENAIYTSKDPACVNTDGSLIKESMTRFNTNWGDDLTGENDIKKARFLLVCPNTEAKSVTVTEVTAGGTYGTPATAEYKITTAGIVDYDTFLQWYSDAEGNEPCGAPADITVTLNNYACSITNGMKTPAGKYYFRISVDGTDSDVVTYTVAKANLKITSGSASKVYDGTPLTCDEYTVEGLADGDGITVTMTGSQTEEGSSPNTFTYQAKAGTDLNNYTVDEKYGTLEVKETAFVVVGEKYEEQYDGKSHEAEIKVIGANGKDITAECDRFQYQTSNDGETFSSWTETVPLIKDAGTIYVKAEAQKGKEIVKSAVFTMEVKPRNIILTSASATKEYDGTALSKPEVEISGDGFVENEGFESVQGIGSVTKVGYVENEIEFTLNASTKPANYKFVKTPGSLTVTPKSVPITITTPTAGKTYDGMPISTGSVSYTADVLVADDSLTVTSLYSGDNALCNAGTYTNRIKSYMVVNGSGEDVTVCYTFTEPNLGTLTIEPRNIIMTSGTECFVYDGNGHTNDNVTVTGAGLVSEEEAVYSGFKKVTEITDGPIENTFTVSATGTFNPHNYNITYVYGKLSVVPAIGVLGGDVTAVYDGTSHEAPAKAVGTAAPVNYSTSTDGKTWSSYSETVPTIKDAGTLYIKAKVTDGNNTAEDSYTITVKPRNITLTTYSATKEYDGTALTNSEYQVTGDGFAAGQGFESVTVTGAQTDVGSSLNNVTYTLTSQTKAANYEIEIVPGILNVTVNTSRILITTESASRVYNGAPLKESGFEVEWYRFVEYDLKLFGDDVLTVVPDGSITDAGSTKNTCTYRVVRDGRDITWFYTIEVIEGDLTVEPRSIVIKTKSAEKVYDGQALTKNDYTIEGDGFLSGQGFDAVNIVGTRTRAGVAVNALDAADPYTFKAGTPAENYKVTVEPGYLKVNKRKVTVTSGSAASTWANFPSDGLANKAACTVSGAGFVDGEIAAGYPRGCTVLEKPASEPEAGKPVSTDNKIAYSWTGNGNPANYAITEVYGELVVTNNSDVKVIATGYVGVYDGQAHGGIVTTNLGGATINYSIDGKEVTDPSKEWRNDAPKFTDVLKDGETGAAGSYSVDVKATDGPTTLYKSYTVTILPRNLKLTAGSASKVYDGTALTCSEYTIGGDGFVAGEKPEISMTFGSTQTDAGKTYNVIQELSDSGTFKVSNYSINYNDGTLEVTRRPVTLTSAGLEVTYDGQKHSNKSVTVSGMDFVEGQGADYSDFFEATDAITYENLFDYMLKEGTNPFNYKITMVYGSFVIAPRQVTVSSGSNSKEYDGTALTCADISITSGSFLAGEAPVFTVTGSRKNVGTAANTFTVDFSKCSGKEINYEIIKDEGTLEVKANEGLRVVLPASTEFNYDGKPHSVEAKAYVGSEPDDSVVVWYSVNDGQNWSDEAPSITEPGTLKVKVMAVKTGYKRVEVSYDLSVVAYRVLYFGNNATGGTVPVDSNKYAVGATVVLLDNTNGLERSGYTFVGWYLNDRFGTVYAPGFSLTLADNLNVYAAWREIQNDTRPSDVGSANAPISNGTWNCGPDGRWTYRTNALFKNTWGYIANPYAKPGQPAQGWFWFDENGIMATGWRLIGGKWYYFNEKADGTQGMLLMNTTTPDGYRVGPDGAWIR